MKLYDHQKKIIDEDPLYAGLWLGTGSGKTRTALALARGKTLVICPKTQKEDGNWEREAKEIWPFGLPLPNAADGSYSGLRAITTMTFDIFKRDHETLEHFDTVIVDEAHGMLGLTPNTRFRKRQEIPKASQRFEALDAFIARTRPARLYLCTATIIKSPMTVFAAWMLLKAHPGSEIMTSFLQFRSQYYTKLPMPGRQVYVPRSNQDAKESLAAFVRTLGYVGRLEDYFDVPEQTFKTDYVELSPAQKARIKELTLEYPEPIVRLGKRHQVENGVLTGDEFTAPQLFDSSKIDKILDYALEFPRMVVFAKYTMQIKQLEAVLSKELKRPIATMTGETASRGVILDALKQLPEYVLIVQAQISAGWELPECPVMIFASRTYSFVDYDQALGRIQRANNIKKNLYINLVVRGGIDEAVDRALANKGDFNEALYAARMDI